MFFLSIENHLIGYFIFLVCRGVVKSSSGESLPAGTVPSSHPYKIPQPPPPIVAKYDPDFPLRKTGSNDTFQFRISITLFCMRFFFINIIFLQIYLFCIN